uniref:Uncharacterized protein n=1 Tax=Anguilla anguilla TaxID=7936 RepID=A0A0E9SPL8_ANGAN
MSEYKKDKIKLFLRLKKRTQGCQSSLDHHSLAVQLCNTVGAEYVLTIPTLKIHISAE